jgi:hypothetical protein
MRPTAISVQLAEPAVITDADLSWFRQMSGPRPGASLNVPMWNGAPKECGDVWTLRKGERVASCRLWTHPLGGEVRLEVDGLWCRGETHREGLALLDVAMAWRSQFEGKGWAR